MFVSNQGQRVRTITILALLFLIFGLLSAASVGVSPTNALNNGNLSLIVAGSSIEAAVLVETERPQDSNLKDVTPTPTSTNTPTPTNTSTSTSTPTATPTSTGTATPTSTNAPTPTNTPTPTPTPFVDLSSSTKHVDKNKAKPGEVLTYTITLTNTGNTQASGVTVLDRLPSDVEYNGHLRCRTPARGWGEETIWWTGEVGVGSPVTVTYQVKVKTGVTEGTVIANPALIQYEGESFETSVTMTTVEWYRTYLPLVIKRYYYCIPPAYISEPNDSIANAQGPLCHDEIYEEYIESDDDDDFYYIWILQEGTVEINLTNIPPGTDYDLFLYDDSIEKVAESRNFEHENEQIVSQVGPGKYYIWVFPYTGYSNTDPYHLMWTFY